MPLAHPRGHSRLPSSINGRPSTPRAKPWPKPPLPLSAPRVARAQKSYNALLWNGRYYRLWSNGAQNTSSDVCLANQLMAQWCANVAGLGNLLPEDRIHSALNTVESLNAKATSYGRPFDTEIHPVGDFGQNIFVWKTYARHATV